MEVMDVSKMGFAGNVEKLMPKFEDIPEQFKRNGNKWVDLVSHWFYKGLKGATFSPKEGIDQQLALKHVAAIMRSWEPKHEHKEAACAYLMSEFFNDVKYPKV
jgi:hypothetical protein